MRANFKQELRGKLFHKAEQKFSSISFFDSLLNSLSLSMRRYSFVYLTILVVTVFTLTSVLKTPLSAQQVLANALENYNQAGDIYHEKLIHERYEKGKLVEASMDDNYFGRQGDFLQFIKNPNTEEILRTTLIVADEFGDEYYFETPFPGLENSPEEQKKWMDFYNAEKIYCASVIENENQKGQVTLRFSKDDPKSYKISQFSLWKNANLNQSLSSYHYVEPGMNQRSNEDQLKSLIKAGPENYEVVREGDKTYYVFKVRQEGDNEVWSYVDHQTFRFSRYEIRSSWAPHEIVGKNITVTDEYLNSQDHSHLFDPNQFNNLQVGLNYVSDNLSYGSENFFPAPGCYDSKKKKIDLKSLGQVPYEGLKEWFDQVEGLDFYLKTWPIDPLLEFPFHFDQVSLPTDAPIKNKYGETNYIQAHAGWDFEAQPNDSLEVRASLEGRVIDISENEWNEGGGNSILITHSQKGNEFQTRYTHLNQINVRVGQTVKQGDRIGEMGRTGKYTFLPGQEAQLGFELILFGLKLDPALLWPEFKEAEAKN